MINAEWGLRTLVEAGADVVLSGHLHRWNVVSPPDPEAPAILQVHCGTGLSTRQRGEPNDFAVIDFDGAAEQGELTVTRWIADENDSFGPMDITRFCHGPDGWRLPGG